MERAPDGRYAVVAGLQEFREHLGGELHVTLLRDIGRSFEVTEMDAAVVTKAIQSLAGRAWRGHSPRRARVAAGAAR
jgi:3-dehydroquinate synthase